MKNVLKAGNSGSILIISVYGMSRKRLILSTSLKRIIVSREKLRPIGLKGASSRALDP